MLTIRRWWWCLLCLPAPLVWAADEPPVARLVAEPSGCVALRQGQTCYQQVSFSWQQASKGSYCLYEKNTTTQLACWQNVSHGRFTLDFQSPNSKIFELRGMNSDNDVEAEVTVQWAYESRKRSKVRWRLF